MTNNVIIKKKRGRTVTRKNQEPFTLYIDKFNKDILKGLCKLSDEKDVNITNILNSIIDKYCRNNENVEIIEYGKAVITGHSGQLKIDKQYSDG